MKTLTKVGKTAPKKNGNGSNGKKGPGAPSKYRPEYCQQLIDHMSEGLSFESFAGVVKVGTTSLERWVEDHEEFRGAKKDGMERCRVWWERLAKIAADDDVDALIQHTGMKPFLKKRTIKTLQNGTVEEVEEYHVPRPSTGMIVFNLVNRFRHTEHPWINAQSHEHTGKDGGPIQTENKNKTVPQFDLSSFTDEELRDFNRLLKAATVPAA